MDLKELTDYIYSIETEYKRLNFENKCSINTKLDSLIYNYGVVKALIINKNQKIENFIKSNKDISKLKSYVKHYCNHKNRDIELFLFKSNSNLKLSIYDYNNGDIIEWDEKHNKILSDLYLNTRQEKLNFLLLYFYYKYNNVFIYNQNNIQQLYRNNLEYGLIKIDDNIEIMHGCKLAYNPPRIYDKSKNKTIFIEIKPNIISLFEKLICEKIVKNIAIRGINYYIFENKNRSQILKEGLQCGSYFDFDLNKLTSPTYIYSKNCNNYLFVFKDCNSITFEEFENYCDDLELIKSQVIHLQYNKEKNIITHIDHEYVFYTNNEYKQKINNINIKGSAMPRYKTFKLDNCKIPFNYPCKETINKNGEKVKTNVPFIFYIVNSYFTNTDIVYEYFNNVISNI